MGATKLMTSAGGGITLDAASTATDKTITVPARTGIMAVDGPAFDATASGSQTVNTGVYSKVLFATENYDTNNNFASSTFTPTVAGYYQIGCNITLGTTTGEFVIAVYKNGSLFRLLLDYTPTSTYAFSSGLLVSMNGSTDYLDIYVYQSSGATKTVSSYSYFQGFLARAA